MTSLIVVQEITHPRTRSLQAHAWNQYYILGLIIASWVNFGCSYIVGTWGWVCSCFYLPVVVHQLTVTANPVPDSATLGPLHPHRCPIRPRDPSIPDG